MRVVVTVAAEASFWSCDFRGVAHGVTGVALHADVLSGERKLGVAIMIEAP